jgi:branched-chain amino acid transport system permease protein
MTDAFTARSGLAARPAALVTVTHYGTWAAVASVFVVLPLVFRSGTALTMMSLMGISIVFALSYNMLLGQTGMLSFGHAVYFGLGAYFAVHGMNAVISGNLPVPLPVIPLAGGLGGLLRRAVRLGVDQSDALVVSLGLAELVAQPHHAASSAARKG